MTLPMRASDPRLWLSIVGAVLALFLLLGQLRHTSPGPLNTVHEREPELQGSDGCAGCHGELLQSMREACAQCHADVQASIEERRGLHGTLSGVEPEACALCHIEHRGDALPLAGPLAFARAGVPERERFDHAPLGLTLEGRHAELGCAECHAQAEAVVLGPEERRFIGLRRECDACHEDVHEGRILRACADCHGQLQPFAEVARFEHARGMRLEGAHAGLACDACHEKDGAHAVELLAGAQPPAGERECRDCHASPHAESFLREVADARRTTSGASCVLCHGGVSLAREHAELVMVVCPGRVDTIPTLDTEAVQELTRQRWYGKANRLSGDDPMPWAAVDAASAASRKP